MMAAKAEVLFHERVEDIVAERAKKMLSIHKGWQSGTETPPTPNAVVPAATELKSLERSPKRARKKKKKSNIAERMQSAGKAYFDADAEEPEQKNDREAEDTNLQAEMEVQAAQGEKQLVNSPNRIAEAGREAPSSSKGKSERVPSSFTISTLREGQVAAAAVENKDKKTDDKVLQPEAASGGNTRQNDVGAASIFTEAAEEGDISIDTTSRTCAELTHWKKLLDEGILSQSEFDDQKKRYVAKQ